VRPPPHAGPRGLRKARGGYGQRVDERIDPETEESLRRWGLARAIWTLLILATFPASVFIWFLGGYWLCGTDTTEPAFGHGACGALVHPVVPG
jgi:hypothetical protein